MSEKRADRHGLPFFQIKPIKRAILRDLSREDTDRGRGVNQRLGVPKLGIGRWIGQSEQDGGKQRLPSHDHHGGQCPRFFRITAGGLQDRLDRSDEFIQLTTEGAQRLGPRNQPEHAG